MSSVRHPDPFNATLLESPVLAVTSEQKMYVREVLDIACSDSKFSQKAYDAISHILTGGSVKVPTVTSLVPNSAEIGDPSFTLHVHGTNFNSGSIIIFAGQEEPTTVVSATELTTGVNMSVWLGPDVLPVSVLSSDGVLSNSMSFTFTDGIQTLVASKSVKSESVKSESVKDKK